MKYGKSQKGQAALEWMMTYGWALLLLTTLIAGLVYIIPHPRTMSPNKCVFGSAIPCLGAQLSSENLTIVLRNGLGQSVYNLTATASVDDTVSCDIDNASARAEQRIVITCNNTQSTNKLNVTEDSKIRVDLRYKKTRDGYDQLIIGEIYAKYHE